MSESELDRIIKTWAISYNEEVLQYAQPAAVNDSEVSKYIFSGFLADRTYMVSYRYLLMYIII